VSLVDPRFLVVQVSEFDRFGRTCVLAGGRDFVRTDVAIVFRFGFDLGVLNPLHAVRTLLHHTTTANRNFRIHHQVLQVAIAMRKLVSAGVLQERLGVAVVEEVETTNFVRTVVAAVT